MYPLATAPHITGDLYHTSRGNNINDFALKCCIIIEIDDLCSSGSYLYRKHIPVLSHLPGRKYPKKHLPHKEILFINRFFKPVTLPL
jgi:hypothetical protein